MFDFQNTEPELQQWQRQAAFLNERESYKEKVRIACSLVFFAVVLS